MKPLTIVTSWNRLDCTKRMLTSLEPSLDALQTIIVDNGSELETVAWLTDWAEHKDVELIALPQNVGCPRALNVALEHRSPGQDVIKLDNDLLLPDSNDWIRGIERLVDHAERQREPIAMIGACYDTFSDRRIRQEVTWEGEKLYIVYPLIGHAVYHSGRFMDEAGYFDVLSPEHIYGFEDNLISAKAAILGWPMVVWTGWQIRDIQRHSALGGKDAVSEHVAAMRPLYELRLHYYLGGGPLHTGPDGYPKRRTT